VNLKTNIMQSAKIYLKSYESALRFATAWTRATGKGYVIQGSLVQVDATEQDKEFIQNYK
jgi:hypothetical protein